MPRLTLYHSPQTRSSGTLVLLEELGAEYDLELINMKAGEQRKPAYLAVNPLGKVPAIRLGESLVTEQGAIFIYLADLFPRANLAPALDDPLRGPYLRWLVFYGSSFEPAIVDRALKRDAAPQAMSPYGDYDSVMRALAEQLENGPYLLGNRMTAADVLWGAALRWTIGFGVVPKLPVFERYVELVTGRPAFQRVAQRDAQWVAEHVKAADTQAT
ncbi:glutathione S-transferase [Pseudomonas sp. 21]|uniref:glutathione S-transferase family protein n=1 Tax=unclassified Pseudomonas TaxID=196821 RepID=UPI00061F1C5E|nr:MULTISPECIES: glutathione S-transferase family protein [unclassified Pseudomonas]KJK01900.1 glutathione S-transferase [Pseudomonas sp. 21]MBV7582575.1 glutathione S-transferase family protein [Pseudomonas sp. PDM33]